MLKQVFTAALAVALLAAPVAKAQEVKPVAVVSLAGVQEILGDISHLTEAAGAGDVGNMVVFFAGAFTQGLDKTKPAGVYVTMDGMEPKPIGFVPTDNVKQVLDAFKQQIGEPEDRGNGIYEVGKDQLQSMFVKQQGSWAFIAQSMDDLSSLPAAPDKLLDGLNSKYSVAIRAYIQNVPNELRQMAVNQMEFGFQQQLENADEEEREMLEKFGGTSIKNMVRMVEEGETLTFGLEVDANKKTVYMDMEMTATDGTSLAKEMGYMADSTTKFGGFMMPNAAVTMGMATKSSPDQTKQVVGLIDAFSERVMQEMAEDGSFPDDATREKAKAILGDLFGIARKTLEGGTLDAGAALVLEPGDVAFGMGAHVVDGKKLEATIKELVEMAKNEPDFPQDLKLDAATHAGVNFHTMTVPVDDEEAAEVLGDKLNMVVGTSADAIYMSFGRDPMGMLKKAIDASGTPAKAMPMQMNVAIEPIIKFAASIEDNPVTQALLDAVQEAGDQNHVRMQATGTPNGVRYRFEVEDGVIKVIGAAAQAAGASDAF